MPGFHKAQLLRRGRRGLAPSSFHAAPILMSSFLKVVEARRQVPTPWRASHPPSFACAGVLCWTNILDKCDVHVQLCVSSIAAVVGSWRLRGECHKNDEDDEEMPQKNKLVWNLESVHREWWMQRWIFASRHFKWFWLCFFPPRAGFPRNLGWRVYDISLGSFFWAWLPLLVCICLNSTPGMLLHSPQPSQTSRPIIPFFHHCRIYPLTYTHKFCVKFLFNYGCFRASTFLLKTSKALQLDRHLFRSGAGCGSPRPDKEISDSKFTKWSLFFVQQNFYHWGRGCVIVWLLGCDWQK